MSFTYFCKRREEGAFLRAGRSRDKTKPSAKDAVKWSRKRRISFLFVLGQGVFSSECFEIGQILVQVFGNWARVVRERGGLMAPAPSASLCTVRNTLFEYKETKSPQTLHGLTPTKGSTWQKQGVSQELISICRGFIQLYCQLTFSIFHIIPETKKRALAWLRHNTARVTWGDDADAFPVHLKPKTCHYLTSLP